MQKMNYLEEHLRKLMAENEKLSATCVQRLK